MMTFIERKQFLKYYLDFSCAFSGMEKSILFVRFDELAASDQTEVLEALYQEVIRLQHIFA